MIENNFIFIFKNNFLSIRIKLSDSLNQNERKYIL